MRVLLPLLSLSLLISPFYAFSEPLNRQDVLQKIETKEAREIVKDLKVSEKLNVVNERNIDREKLQVKTPKSCDNTLTMMEKRLDVLESNLKKRRALVEKTSLILNKKIANLKSKGLDTSKTEISLQEYLNGTNELLKQREGSIMVLADLTRFDCDGDPANFKNNLKDFNQRFKNHNLEFNKLNRELRVNVLYEISSLSKKLEESMKPSEENN